MENNGAFTSKRTGLTTRYLKKGTSTNALLLIHGLGCSSLEWSENIDYLSENISVIAVDLIGFGASDKPNRFVYSANAQALQLIELMQELGFHEFHLAGNSYGGKVAIEIVDLIKERAKSLTLVASAGGGKEAPFPLRLQTLPIIGELLPSPNFEQFKLGWQLAFHDKNYLTEERVKKKFEDLNKVNAKKSHLKTLRQMINIFGFKKSDYTNLSSKVGRITCPVLIVWGANDLFLPLEHAHNFNKKIKNSKLVIYEECGHAPQIERSKEFNDLLTKFIVI